MSTNPQSTFIQNGSNATLVTDREKRPKIRTRRTAARAIPTTFKKKRTPVPASFLASLAEQTDALKSEGLFKRERLIAGPQQAAIDVRSDGHTEEVLNLCANNYLGLANHPEVIEAALK